MQTAQIGTLDRQVGKSAAQTAAGSPRRVLSTRSASQDSEESRCRGLVLFLICLGLCRPILTARKSTPCAVHVLCGGTFCDRTRTTRFLFSPRMALHVYLVFVKED